MMKTLSIFVFLALFFNQDSKLKNTVWAYNVTPTCVNTLKFISNHIVLEYNCELDYAFHSSYQLFGDTVIISGKDDSHSEDNGKINQYWVTTYLIRNNGLYQIKNKVSDHGKWKVYDDKNVKNPDYKKVK
ncbi:MAG: hypothetical protein ACHQHN_15970 [Sphingobacteriales bacterium]